MFLKSYLLLHPQARFFWPDGEAAAAAAAACRLMLLLMQKAIMKHRLIQGNEVNCSAELW